MFQRTTAINKLLAMQARKRVVQGGTSAGKTYGIIPVIIDWCAKNPRKKVTIVAETIPAVKDGALDIFKKVMYDTGRWIESNFIGNPMEYTFSNNTVVQFKAFDSVGKAKASGKRDLLFLNEANHIDYEIADALMIRSLQTWIDFNPDAEFWAHTEVLTEPNSEFLLLTFEDNEAIPKETLEDLQTKLGKAYHNPLGDRTKEANIKSQYWHNWCRVYIDGEIGSLQGVVFDNWKILPEVPPGATFEHAGMDFGYTNDPTTLIGYHRLNNMRIFDEMFYRKGLQNSEIARLAKSEGIGRITIEADSAEPKSIDELKGYGLNIKGAVKGADSINYGISLLQEEPFYVTARSINLIRELRFYKWATDKAGNSLNKPIDAFNHGIDPMRYIAMAKFSKKPTSSLNNAYQVF